MSEKGKNVIDLDAYDLKTVHDILYSGQSEFVNHPKVKIVKSTCFDKFWLDLEIKKFFVIAISEEIISDIDLKVTTKNFATTMAENYSTNNYIELNKDFELEECKSIDINQKEMKKISLSKKVVFFFGELGIDIYVGGQEFDRINVFTDEVIQKSYSQKFSIHQLPECIKQYTIHVNTPGNRESFFVDKTQLNLIANVNGRKNILRLRPEDQLRNNLFSYLQTNMQHTWWKEDQLDSKKRLDLRTEANGLSVFLEVKWIGRSIHQNGRKITKGYSFKSLRDGVNQSLNYIKELNEDMNIKSPINYLCAFDAREEGKRKAIDWKNFSFIPPELQHYYDNNFSILPIIEINHN